MNLELANQIAETVLYEGYILYPYRSSALKNRQRFTFGVLAPHSPHDAQDDGQPSSMCTECLIEGDRPVVDVRIRFLHLVSREVFRRETLEPAAGVEADARYELVPSLDVCGRIHHTWQEAVTREIVVDELSLCELAATSRQVEFAFEPTETSEELHGADGNVMGKLVRRQHRLRGTVTIRANVKSDGLRTILVEVQNTTPVPPGQTRDGRWLRSLASAHILLVAHGGRFVSAIDPPPVLAELAAACRNVGVWPILAGEEGARDLVLSLPIILGDYPQIAAESRGEFFDGTEIDEMLALRVMTLTDAEKRDMLHVDDRARQILERTESLSPQHWQKLHGAIRGLKTTRHT